MLIPHSRPTLDERDIVAVSRVIKSGQIAEGRQVKQFEKAMAAYIGTKGAAAVSSGTTALYLSLVALGVKPGDEVILPSFVCMALLSAVNQLGAKAKICDIDPEDFNISFADAKRKINADTKAIIIPHMFGRPAEINKFLKLGIPVIEDCAQSVGAKYKGKKIGSFGLVSVFSFYSTKMLTCGEGGMVCSDSLKIIEKIKDFREYDKKAKLGDYFNYKMTDIEAALGLSQLKKLPRLIAKRKQIAGRFNQSFSKAGIDLPKANSDKNHIFYHYTLRTRLPLAKVITDLEKKGVSCRRPVFRPLHRYLNLKGFPNTEDAFRSVLSVPCYPSLNAREFKKIKNAVADYFCRKTAR